MNNNATFGLEIYFPDDISNIIFDYSRNPKYEEAVKKLDEVFGEVKHSAYDSDEEDEKYEDNYATFSILEEIDERVSYLNFDRNDVYIMGNGVYNKDLFNHYINNHFIYDIKFNLKIALCRNGCTRDCECEYMILNLNPTKKIY